MGSKLPNTDPMSGEDKMKIFKNSLNKPAKEQDLKDLVAFIYQSEINRNSLYN